MENKPNSNLTDRLEELARLANDSGAEGIFLIRGVKDASLVYTPEGETKQPYIPSAQSTMNITLQLEIADAGVLVLMRFPADGQEPGIEVR